MILVCTYRQKPFLFRCDNPQSDTETMHHMLETRLGRILGNNPPNAVGVIDSYVTSNSSVPTQARQQDASF